MSYFLPSLTSSSRKASEPGGQSDADVRRSQRSEEFAAVPERSSRSSAAQRRISISLLGAHSGPGSSSNLDQGLQSAGPSGSFAALLTASEAAVWRRDTGVGIDGGRSSAGGMRPTSLTLTAGRMSSSGQVVSPTGGTTASNSPSSLPATGLLSPLAPGSPAQGRGGSLSGIQRASSLTAAGGSALALLSSGRSSCSGAMSPVSPGGLTGAPSRLRPAPPNGDTAPGRSSPGPGSLVRENSGGLSHPALGRSATTVRASSRLLVPGAREPSSSGRVASCSPGPSSSGVSVGGEEGDGDDACDGDEELGDMDELAALLLPDMRSSKSGGGARCSASGATGPQPPARPRMALGGVVRSSAPQVRPGGTLSMRAAMSVAALVGMVRRGGSTGGGGGGDMETSGDVPVPAALAAACASAPASGPMLGRMGSSRRELLAPLAVPPCVPELPFDDDRPSRSDLLRPILTSNDPSLFACRRTSSSGCGAASPKPPPGRMPTIGRLRREGPPSPASTGSGDGSATPRSGPLARPGATHIGGASDSGAASPIGNGSSSSGPGLAGVNEGVMARLIMLDRRMVHGNLAEINQGHKVGTNGISLRYLFKFEEALPPGPITTEQVAQAVIMPRSAVAKCRFTDIAPITYLGPPRYFISHAWSGDFHDLCAQLRRYVSENGYDASSMFVWLDLLCSNLHTGMGPKDLGHLQEAIIASKQILLVVDAAGAVFNRTWVWYELWAALMMVGRSKYDQVNDRLQIVAYDPDWTTLCGLLAAPKLELTSCSLVADKGQLLGELRQQERFARLEQKEPGLTVGAALVKSLVEGSETQFKVAERLRVANPRRHASAIISHAMVLAVAGQYWKAEKLLRRLLLAAHDEDCVVRPGSSEAANVAWGLGSLMAAGGFMDEAERLAREAHATYSARHKAVGAEGMTAAERRGHAGTCVLLARVTMARGDPAAAEDFARQVMALHRAPRGGWAGAAADVSSAHGKGPASPKGAPPSPPAPEPPPSNTPDAAPEPAAPDTRPVVPPLPLGPNSASQLNLQLPVGTVMPLGAVTPGGPLPVSRALISALRVMGLLKVQAAKGRRVEHWEHHVGTNGVAGRDALQRAEQYLREAADLASKWLGTYHSDTLTAHTELIEVLQDLGRVGDAQREADAVIAACAMLHGPSAPDTLRARVLRGAALLTGDDLEGAEEELRGVLGECEGALGASHGVTVRCREALGRVRDAWQQAGEAYLRDRNERLAEVALRRALALCGPTAGSGAAAGGGTAAAARGQDAAAAVVRDLAELLRRQGRHSNVDDILAIAEAM